jgi:hypothetical protein
MNALPILLACFPVLAMAAEVPTVASTPEQRAGVSVTVYNSNRAMVTEIREVALPEGRFRLDFEGVPSAILPQTVALQGLDGAPFRVLEQNYEYDLISPQKLLEKFVGRDAVLVQLQQESSTTVPRRTTARLLAANNGTVWKAGGAILSNPSYSWLEYPEVPENLYARPTLVWLGESEGGKARLEASYLTGGMTWSADYVFTLGEAGKAGDLTGWVTLNNTSGAAFRNADLKLIAGDVQVVQEEDRSYEMRTMAAKAAPAPQFQEKSFFEYHLYTLERKTDLGDNQQKQVELLRGEGVPAPREYLLEGQPWYYRQKFTGDRPKVAVRLKLQNRQADRLGMPLPAGIVRVYQRDADGSAQFVGEDRIDHTPKDETFTLRLGNAFDLAAERKQKDFAILSNCLYESEYELKVRNHKAEDVVVRVVEPVGGEWTLVRSSHPHEKTAAFACEFQVPVKRDGEAVLTYRVRVKVCD